MKEFKQIILTILKEIQEKEMIVKTAGGRGGSGKVFPANSVGVLRKLGHESLSSEEEYVLKPVEISKAFKKEDKND